MPTGGRRGKPAPQEKTPRTERADEPRGAGAGETEHEDYDSAAGLFRALSHPLRVRLVCGLLQEPLTQTDIARLLGLSQSLVAQHLSVLRHAGLVRGHRRGGEVILEVVDQRLPAIFAAVCGDADRFLSSGWQEVSRRTETKKDS